MKFSLPVNMLSSREGVMGDPRLHVELLADGVALELELPGILLEHRVLVPHGATHVLAKLVQLCELAKQRRERAESDARSDAAMNMMGGLGSMLDRFVPK